MAGRPRKESAANKLARLRFDPLTLLVRHAQGKERATPEEIEIAKELMPYAYPRLRSVEASVFTQTDVTVYIGGTQQLPELPIEEARAIAKD